MKAAINWAASQSWSTITVGMYGKSYDAVTGLIGNDLKQSALKAVVAGEPVGLAKSSLQVGAAYRALDSGWDAARVITSLLYRSLENDEAAWVKTLPLSPWTMLTQWACRGGQVAQPGWCRGRAWRGRPSSEPR